MRLLIPIAEMEEKQRESLQQRKMDGRFFNGLDCVILVLAMLGLLAAGLLCFAPMTQSGYMPRGNFVLSEQTGLVDINTASAMALQTLPGVGEKKAAAIRKYIRENGAFSDLEQVAQVPGISADMIKSWRGLADVS